MHVAIPLFPRFTALDAVGPYEVLQRIPSIDVTFVAARPGELRSENGMLGMVADASFDDLVDPDVVLFPGGVGTREVQRDDDARSTGSARPMPPPGSPRRFAPDRWSSAPPDCQGLDGHDPLACSPSSRPSVPCPTAQRVVEHLDQRIITAAGVSSGIDMALRLVELLVDRTAAEAAQLMIEYDPQPPFDAGSLGKASDGVVERVIEYASHRS